MPDQRAELLITSAFLEARRETPADWTLHSSDRPDVEATHRSGRHVGIEVTELWSADEGSDRAQDNRVRLVIEATVLEFLARFGGRGGSVTGTTARLPAPAESLETLRLTLMRHLELHGQDLRRNKGAMTKRFNHPWGHIDDVGRIDDWGRVCLMEGGWASLDYKAPKNAAQLQRRVIDCLRSKAGKAGGYAQGRPLWLVIRNPHQHVHSWSSADAEAARRANAGVFDEVFLFNLPQDRIDLRPPEPRVLSLL